MSDEELKPVEVPLIYEMIGRAQTEGAGHVLADALASASNGLVAIANSPVRGPAMKSALEIIRDQCAMAIDLCTPLTSGERPDDAYEFNGFGGDGEITR